MKNVIKIAFLTSIITAAMVYVVPVRIQVRQQPEVLVRVRSQERVDHDHSLAFVPVDTADDKHARPRPGAMKNFDRPMLRRPPDDGGNG